MDSLLCIFRGLVAAALWGWCIVLVAAPEQPRRSLFEIATGTSPALFFFVSADTPADFDGDGLDDLAILANNSLSIYLSDGSDSFQKKAESGLPPNTDPRFPRKITRTGGGPLPEPRGVCGFDRTPDDLGCEVSPGCSQ